MAIGVIILMLLSIECHGGTVETEYTVANIEGFLKLVRNNNTAIRKCWNGSKEYSIKFTLAGKTEFTDLCENDTKSYQVCGELKLENYQTRAWILDDNANHCGYYICKESIFKKVSAGLNNNRIANCVQGKCLNTDYNIKGCNDALKCHLSSFYNKDSRCDGVKDCTYGTDEVDCKHSFGVSCIHYRNHAPLWVKPNDLCKTGDRCQDNKARDEAMCNAKIGNCTRINHSGIESTVSFIKEQKCPTGLGAFGFHLLCHDGINLINCTNSDIVFTCQRKDTTITLTDTSLCRGFKLCDDDIINKCHFEPPRRLHRHFLCDGKNDFENASEDAKCKSMETPIRCVRRIRAKGDNRELSILKNWVLDGVVDCEDGKDEDPMIWRRCNLKNVETSDWIPRNDKCELRFNCTNGEFMPLQTMCMSSVDSNCNINQRLCETAYDQTNLTLEAATSNKTVKVIGRNVPGLLQDFSGYESYILKESYGTEPIKLKVEKGITFNCNDLYGEVYVYISCLGLCSEPTSCPLHRSKVHHSKSCPFIKEENRILTLTKDNNLTFVEKVKNENGSSIFVNKEIYQCDNGNCIPYKEVCNLIDNCGDGSDEKYCENNFFCKNTGRYISKKMLCDGIKHCDKGEDECSASCSSGAVKSIIPKVWLQIVAWLIGVPATMVNVIVIVKNIRNLCFVSSHTKINFFMTVLVSIIASGDLLVGIYLIGISIENLVWKDFCYAEYEWLTSSRCSAYGILSTVGSQVSLFSMTMLSMVRAYIMRRFIPNKNADRAFYMKTFAVCAVIIISSLLIALIPVNNKLELEYFFNGYYVDELPFIARPRKLADIKAILQVYYDNATLINNADAQQVKKLTIGMIAESDRPLSINFKVLGFYGSSGSCIFKYFVNSDDSQHHYSMILIVVNFTCFLVISASYLMVNAITMRSAAKVGKSNIGQLQRKISFIIGTDFLCWFPFIIVCLLHFYRVLDATKYYPEFSILILPINSLVNPLLYDSNNFFVKMPKKVGTVARQYQRQIHSWSRRALNLAVTELRGETERPSVAVSTHITTAGV